MCPPVQHARALHATLWCTFLAQTTPTPSLHSPEKSSVKLVHHQNLIVHPHLPGSVHIQASSYSLWAPPKAANVAKLIRRRRISLKRDNHPQNPSVKSILKFVYFEQKGVFNELNLVAIREVSMDRPAMSTRRRASNRRLRLLFVATADKVDMRSLLDLGILGLLPLRLRCLLGGVVVLVLCASAVVDRHQVLGLQGVRGSRVARGARVARGTWGVASQGANVFELIIKKQLSDVVWW